MHSACGYLSSLSTIDNTMVHLSVMFSLLFIMMSMTLADFDLRRQSLEKNRLLDKLQLIDRPPRSRIDMSRFATNRHLIDVHRNRITDDDYDDDEDVEDGDEWLIIAQNRGNVIQCREHIFDCFQFTFPTDIQSISTAQLTVTIDNNYRNLHHDNETIEVWLMNMDEEKQLISQSELILSSDITIHIDLTSISTEWLNDGGQKTIMLQCRTCFNQQQPMISFGHSFDPIIQLYRAPINRPTIHSRYRRSFSCPSDGSCCLNRFYMNFTEIGWDDWILQPKGYDANYCAGSCLYSGNVIQLHSRLLHTIAYSKRQNDQDYASLLPCCSPKRLSALRIIYSVDGDIRTKKVADMKALECGC